MNKLRNDAVVRPYLTGEKPTARLAKDMSPADTRANHAVVSDQQTGNQQTGNQQSSRKDYSKELYCDEQSREDIVKISKESWVAVTILAACIVFSSFFLRETFHWVHRAQMTFLIAAPVSDSGAVQRASMFYNGLLLPDGVSENEIHLKSFDYVWEKINESYWEEDFGGVDWEQAKKDLRPKIEKAKNIKEVREILNELIGRLGKSHFAIIPNSAYDATNVKRKGSADSGLTLRLSGEKVLVSAVRDGSDAQAKGVKPGWELKSVEDKKISDLLRKAKESDGIVRIETMVAFSFGNLLTGPEGSAKNCEFILPSGESEKVELSLAKGPGNRVKFGNLPAITVDVQKKLLGSNVGYFRFSAFFDPVRVMPEFRKALKEFASADGLIIDIRGNGGGMAGMTMGLASPLTDKPAPLGVMKMKNSELKFALFKTPKPYGKKIAVLVDEASASASEIYAGGLQDLKIARIFGRRTAGLSLPSTVEKLPNGDGFQYAFANYTSASGKILEGNGVVPDEKVELTVENLSEEIDPTLKKAVEWIHSSKK